MSSQRHHRFIDHACIKMTSLLCKIDICFGDRIMITSCHDTKGNIVTFIFAEVIGLEAIVDYLQDKISTGEFFNILYSDEQLEKALSKEGIYMFLIEGDIRDKDFIFQAKQLLDSYRRRNKFFYDSEINEQLNIAQRYKNRRTIEIDRTLDFHFDFVQPSSDEDVAVGEGVCYLFKQETQYNYDKGKISLLEAERYINEYLKLLSENTIDEICDKACQWKNDTIDEYPDVEYPAGLDTAQGRDILRFIELNSIYIYRNPYDENDLEFSSSFYCIPAWDEENHMEILIKGKEVYDVREFLGYGEFAFWKAKDYSK